MNAYEEKEAAITPLGLATAFHEIYESLAPSFGYETREETREFDPESKNGRLMVATCAEILCRFQIGIKYYTTNNNYGKLNLDDEFWETLSEKLRPVLEDMKRG